MLKDERSGAHAEEFRECGKTGDLPSVSGTRSQATSQDSDGALASAAKCGDARAFEGLFLFHGRRAPATRRLDACHCHVRVTLTFFAACRPGAALPVEESYFSCPGKKVERLYPPA